MVDLVLRDSALTQIVSSAPIVPTNLVVRSYCAERSVIPSIGLPGTRLLRTQDLRNSFQLSTVSYSQTISASSSTDFTKSASVYVTKAVVVTSAITTILAVAVSKAISNAASMGMSKVLGLSQTISTSISSAFSSSRVAGYLRSIGISGDILVTLNAGRAYIRDIGIDVGTALSTALALLFERSVNASSTESVAVPKVIGTIKSISVGSEFTPSKLISRIINLTGSTTLAIVKTILCTFGFAVLTSLDIISGLSYFKDVQVSSSSSSLVGKSISITRDLAQEAVLAAHRAVSKINTITESCALSLSKLMSLSKTVSVTEPASVLLTKLSQVVKNASVTSTLSVIYSLFVSIVVDIQETSQLHVTKTISLAKYVLNSPLATLEKLRGVLIAVLTTTEAGLNKAIQKINSVISASVAFVTKSRDLVLNFASSALMSFSYVVSRAVYRIYSMIYAAKLDRKVYAQVLDRLLEDLEQTVSYVFAPFLDRLISEDPLKRLISVNMDAFSPKIAEEVQNFGFDFSSVLASGETIDSATIAYSTPTGVTNSNTLYLSGSVIIDGSVVTRKVGGGLAGDLYTLKCTINTSLSQSFILSGSLSIT